MNISYYSVMGRESFDSHKENLGKVFKGGNTYKVPPNQRDFEWDKSLLEYFWEDLLNSYTTKDKAYFFGSTIFEYNENNNDVIVYDGQQRLATVNILWAVIRDMLWELKEEEIARTIQNSYISHITEKERYVLNLTLNLRNKDFFHDCIQLLPNDKNRKDFATYESIIGKLSKTNDNIKRCYLFFQEEIKKEFEKKKLTLDKEKVDFLTDISEHLRDHFLIVIVEVRDEEEAYMVYEAINQKRLELSVADLFKNYLIRKTTDKDDKEKIIILWKEIADSLDNEVRTFLKHYWHSKKGVITERRLFRELKKYIEEEKKEPLTLVKELNEESKIYSALKNPGDEFWEDKIKIKELIEEFNSLDVEQPLPLLVMGFKKFNDDNFKELLKDIIAFSIRYNIICNLPPNVLEKEYSQIARKIRNDEIKDAKSAFALLQKYYPDDKEFVKTFVGKTIGKNKIALVLWIKINEHLTEYEKPQRTDLSLEHILPQHPNKEWLTYLKKKGITADEDIEELKYRIGNLTAMDVKMNNEARNKFFTKKRDEHYKDSKMPINEDLKSITDWGEKEIKSREKKYSEIAKEIWKIEI